MNIPRILKAIYVQTTVREEENNRVEELLELF